MYTCWVYVYLSGICILVGYMYTCWVYVYLLGICILVGYMYTCWVYVYLLGICILVGYMYICWVYVYLLGICISEVKFRALHKITLKMFLRLFQKIQNAFALYLCIVIMKSAIFPC